MRHCCRGKVDILFAYLTRRFSMMLLIIFGASYIAYNLQAISSDPLAGLAESTEENAEYLRTSLIRSLNLDVPPPIRYFIWFRGVLAGLWGQFDLGQTRTGISVIEAIELAIPVTIRLVIAATILAIVLGITRSYFSHSLFSGLQFCSRNTWLLASTTSWQNPRYHSDS